jgi:hypothetical protein
MATLTSGLGLFKRKADPITERSRQLNDRIADLESKIQQLSRQVEPEDPRRVRSTPDPPGAPDPIRRAPPEEPVFERVDLKQIKEVSNPPDSARPLQGNGAGKFDLMAGLERIKRFLQGPPAANPKLVNYLAAGNIQGLKPLRYEKRVARNRFVALTVVLVIVLFGLFCFLARRH